MQRARRPAKARQDVVIELAFDGQIARQGPIQRHIRPDSLDVSNDRGQSSCRCLALTDFDVRTRKGAQHNVRAASGEPDIVGDTAAGTETTDDPETKCGGDGPEVPHGDGPRRSRRYQTPGDKGQLVRMTSATLSGYFKSGLVHLASR